MRIQEILNYRKPTMLATVCGTAAALAVGIACLASPVLAETPLPAASVTVQAEAGASTNSGAHHPDHYDEHDTAHHDTHHRQYSPSSAAAPAAGAAHHDETLLWPVPDHHYVSRWCVDASATNTGHSGADIVADSGADILAASSGTVTYAGFSPEDGWAVVLDHGSGISTRYAHCANLYVRAGQSVAQGQRIAAMGNTGRSTGTHLHFEVLQDGEALRVQDLFESYTQQ